MALALTLAPCNSEPEVLGDDSSPLSKIRRLLKSEGELDRAALVRMSWTWMLLEVAAAVS